MTTIRKIWSEAVDGAPPAAGATILRASLEQPVQVEGRRAVFVASDPSVGRDMHTIAADAWDTSNFQKNPVFLWSHDADSPPIGRVDNLYTSGDRLMAAVRYPDEGAYPFADTIYNLVKGRFINAVSTGWRPIAWRAANDRDRPGGVDFSKVELLELSQVAVPALPTALAAARSAGINVRPFAAWAERQLDSGDSIISREVLNMARKAATAAKVYPAVTPPEPCAPRVRSRLAGDGAISQLGRVAKAVAATAGGATPIRASSGRLPASEESIVKGRLPGPDRIRRGPG